MSHFSVLVIGDNVEVQLQPYHEFECTGIDDQYVENVLQDMFEARRDYERHGEKYTISQFCQDWYGVSEIGLGESPDTEGAHKWGWVRVDVDGEPVEIIRRTNPNAKWDWYQVGGRWNGFFRLKPEYVGQAPAGNPGVGGDAAAEDRADVVRKYMVDFDSMAADAEESVHERFERLLRVTEGMTVPATWKQVRETYPDDEIDKARDEFHSEPWVRAVHQEFSLWLTDTHEYFGDIPVGTLMERGPAFQAARQRAVQRAVNEVAVPYAFVKDAVWYGRGDMGWWGISTNEADKDEWNKRFHEMLRALPDDEMLTCVDCHI